MAGESGTEKGVFDVEAPEFTAPRTVTVEKVWPPLGRAVTTTMFDATAYVEKPGDFKLARGTYRPIGREDYHKNSVPYFDWPSFFY